MDDWKTTVAELLEIFRAALVALLPAMERARIPWRDGEAYDEWDEISQTLYKNVVARSLQWALGGELELDKVLPRYNMKLASYSNRSVLLVSGPKVAGQAVFVGFSSSEEPFDTVDCVHVNESGTIVGEIVKQPFQETTFSFAHKLEKHKEVFTDLYIEV